MKQVNQLLEREIVDATIEVADLTRAQHRMSNRGKPPVGATWNRTVKEELDILEAKKWYLYEFITECNNTLELIKNAEAKKSCG